MALFIRKSDSKRGVVGGRMDVMEVINGNIKPEKTRGRR